MKLLGLDVVNLANNHSTNFGKAAFLDTLKLLKKHGIKYTGAGRDYEEAHSPTFFSVNGIRLAFLGYNSVKASLNAGKGTPGIAWISKDPYYPVNEPHFRKVEADVRKAKRKAGIVIVWFHWSKEDVYYPRRPL